MKRKSIIILMIIITLLNTFLPITNAFSIDKANLKKDHDINTHIQYYNTSMKTWRDIQCGYINYELDGEKYPAYCIVPGAHGVDEEGPYTVTITDLLKDKLIYNTMINGYPYKTPSELGVANADDAYVATKHAIKCAILDRDVKSYYKGKDTRGENIVDAIYNISEAGKKGTAVNQDANLKINKVNNLVENGNYYYQEYSVSATANISNYNIEKLQNFPSGTYVTDTNGNKKEELSGNQKFRVMIPKSSFNKNISGNVEIEASCNTNPVFYGEAPKGKKEIQNYAVAYKAYAEYKTTSTLQATTNTASIKVVKKDEDTLKPIEGVSFGLYQANGTLVSTEITNNEGIAIFKNLYQGKYFIKEIKANDNYILDDTQYEVQAEFNKQIEKVITNEHKKGNLKIIKVDKDDHNVTLGAIEFDLLDSDRKTVAHLITDVNGEAYIENIDTGTYTLKETKTKREYELCVDEDITVKWNETTEAIIENEKIKGKIKIVKMDKDHNEIKLAGVKFQIIDINNRIVEEVETDENGEALTSRLPLGEYKIKEISLGTNTQYFLNEQLYTVKIENSEISQLNIYNEHKKGKLKIYKVDKDNHQIPLEGIEFEVIDKDGFKYNVVTDKNGMAQLDDIRTGMVNIKETKTNEQYVLPQKTYEIEIKHNQCSNITIENEKKKGQVEVYKLDKDNHKIKIPNVEFIILDENNNIVERMVTNEKGYALSGEIPIGNYAIKETKTNNQYVLKDEIIKIKIEEDKVFKLNVENEKIKGKIQIIKSSSKDSPRLNITKGEHLTGVKFEIYDENANLVDTIITDENGQALSKELEIGRYKIKEINTIKNYLLNTNEFIVNIEKNNEIIVLNVENEPIIPDIHIEKVGQQYAEKNEEIKYNFTIENKGNSDLENFTWKDYLPYNQVKVTKLVTGTYNENLDYEIYYKTNQNDYRLFAKANTQKNEYLNFASLDLLKDEKITEIKVEFGTVSSNFKSINHPVIYAKVNQNVKKDEKIINTTELFGNIEDYTISDKSIFETVITEKEKLKKLPKTGC